MTWIHSETARGIRVSRYVEEQSRPWIVFVHGVGTQGSAWWPWAGALVSRFNLAAFDMPGYGGSPLVDPVPRDLTNLRSYIEEVQDHLGVGTSILVGESLGGTACLSFAIERSSRVRGLVLCSTGFRGALITEIGAWPTVLAESGIAGWSKYMIKCRFTDRDPSKIKDQVEKAQLLCDPEVLLADGDMLRMLDLRDALVDVKVPTLLLEPGSSPFIDREHATQLEDGLSDAELILIGASRHGVAFAYADECSYLTGRFLQRRGLDGSSSTPPGTALYST